MSINIKVASIDDGADILNIYAPYVQSSNITFEYDVPSLEDMTNRICQTLDSYPYLVAEVQGQIVGYAYASSFHSRAAYQWGSELSIYLDQHYHGQAIGKKLYQEVASAFIVSLYILNFISRAIYWE